MRKATSIRANATELQKLSHEMEAKFRLRQKGDPQMEAWREACREFHESYDLLAFPGGLGYSMRRLAQNDQVAIEHGVQFLEVDPIFFRSGYIKEEILKQLSRIPLNADQKKRLQQVILARVRDTRTRREFRRYCRLAPAVSDPRFEQKIAEMAGPTGAIATHAQWVLAQLRQSSSKKRTK